ncbi:MAG: DUF3990 domain-containing protein [Clostridiales Family XIII bacterium]|jgi:hypothetical protein|nr:DUF3990 domain-containing protein [Clostridiales Family XIII bacterium]
MTATKLYHGSNMIFDKVQLSKSRDRRDFGRGFYTTTIKEQAEQWAKSLFDRYGGAKQLYEFECECDETLNIKIFHGLTLEWLEMVKDNRMSGGLQHSFDIVQGPVANDNTMPTIALYVDGALSAEATLIDLGYFKVNDQISFHTEKALESLKLIQRINL